MNNALPWDQIGLPSSDYAVRLVEGAGVVRLNWGRDTAGRALFIVELEGDHTETYRRDVTVVHGIQTDLRSDVPGRQRLVLTLDRSVDQDLFHGCASRSCEALSARRIPASLSRWRLPTSGGGRRSSPDGPDASCRRKRSAALWQSCSTCVRSTPDA